MKIIKTVTRAVASFRLVLALTLFLSALVFSGIAFSQFKLRSAKAPDAVDPDKPQGYSGELDEGEYIAKRQAFIALLRGVDPARPVDPEARVRANALMDRQVEALQTAQRESAGTDSTVVIPNWIELGPNPIPLGQTQTTRVAVSGRISAIEIDPADSNKVYAAAAQGGVYRSLDGGANWTPIFEGAESLSIGALTLDPANGWLWVGTGEANGSADCYAGVGLYRIENVNTTANLVGPINPIRNYNNAANVPVSGGFFSGRSISKIVRVPGDPNTLFVGVAGGIIGLGASTPFGNNVPPLAMRGLVRLSNVQGPAAGIAGTRMPVSTTDNGFGLCLDTPCTVNRSANDLVLDPQDPTGNTVIVWLNGTNVAGDGGIYRSTNAMSGSPTFTQTFVTTSTSTGNGRGELRAYVRGTTTVIYVASGEPSTGTICNSTTSFGALRRSDDGGATWSVKLLGGGGFCAGQCFYNIGFDVLPGAATTTDKLMLGGNVRSTSCAKQQSTSLDGASTTFVSNDLTTHADTHVIKIAPSDSNVVYRGDDGGVWKSTDGGVTWANQNNSTLRATQFQSIAVHPTNPNISIGGTQDNGTNMLLSSGTAWLHAVDGDGGFSLIDQSTPNTMYSTFFNQVNSQIGYSRSTTGGAFGSWTFLGCSGSSTTNGIACSSATTTAVNFYCPTALGPGSPNNTVYIGTDRLLRSSTQGTANVTVSQAPLIAGVAVSAIGISSQDDNYRFVGNNNGALWFTTTGSSTLTNLDPVGAGSVIPDLYVSRIVFDPNEPNTAYIALGGYAGGTGAAQSHIWRATNLNTTPVLTAINGSGVTGLPDVPANAFAADRNDPANPNVAVLYAGTDIGVFRSTDNGASWAPYGTGFPRVAVFDMAIQNVKRVLRIATHGRGMWEIALNPLAVTTAASRKTHLAAGMFDINLPLSGAPGVECRTGGGSGDYTIVATFTNDVASGSASVSSGTGSVSGSPTFSGNTMTVNLTGVTDVQQILVSLNGVTDTTGQTLPTQPVPMRVLVGDVNENNSVNATDVSVVKSSSGATVSSVNFRADVTADGAINSSDVGLTKLRSGNSL
ncbi:MAG: dockerin type I domain-containing protein [Chthoniobacterales bacterium]